MGTWHDYIANEKEEQTTDTYNDMYETRTTTRATNDRNSDDFLRRSKRDLTVPTMRADLDRKKRDPVRREFRLGSSRALTTTRLPARGNDVQQVVPDTNVDTPRSMENNATDNGVRTRKDAERCHRTHIEEMPMDMDDPV